MDIRKAKRAYASQKCGAKRRGIEFRLTFEQWLEFWGEDLPKRGRGRFDLIMQRPCDSGPYALGNIRKGTPRENIVTREAMRIKPGPLRCGGHRWSPSDDDVPPLGYVTMFGLFD